VVAVDPVVRPRSFRNPRSVVEVLIQLAATDLQRMRPGMRIQGTIQIERREDVVAAPLAALGFDGEGPFVVVPGATRGKQRPRLGARDANWVEVLEGLETGDLLESPRRGDV
jgi:multidrug efflux pump subunit AcrA (membrane-fusion protein)